MKSGIVFTVRFAAAKASNVPSRPGKLEMVTADVHQYVNAVLIFAAQRMDKSLHHGY